MNTNPCFVATTQCKTSNIYISSGNIVPNEWYQQFTNNRGTPDLPLISVLSEIVYWYRPKRFKDPITGVITYLNKFLGDAWQTSYEHFEKKFGFNREKLRRIFIKLEQMGICTREFRDVKLRGQTYNNRLFIHLSSEFLNSCTTHKEKKSILENENTDCNISFFAVEEEGGSPRFEGDHIIDIKNKNINKDRSIKSNFYKNPFDRNFKTNSIETEHSDKPNIDRIKDKFSKAKELKDFYPLSVEDCKTLQISSGREFTLNAMNEILLDMSQRVKGALFHSKKRFLSYMGDAFTWEMRDAVRTSNENFRIKNNHTEAQVKLKEQDEFLTKIENSLEVSPEWHLKKKLACVLEGSKSYQLLQAYRSSGRVGGVFEIHLDKYVQLQEWEKEIVFQQVKATHESIDFENEGFGFIEKLEIIMPQETKNNLGCIDKKYTRSEKLPANIWGMVRQKLLDIYDIHVDRHWFSKLDAEIDEEGKTLRLRAPSELIKDWIQTNYFGIIEKLGRGEKYRVVMV